MVENNPILIFHEQDHNKATYANKIEKFEGEKNVDIAELQDVLKFVQSLHGYYGAVNKRGGETTPID